MKGKGIGKKRSSSCYHRKIKRLTDIYNNCPKIQKKHTLENWLSKIKKYTTGE